MYSRRRGTAQCSERGRATREQKSIRKSIGVTAERQSKLQNELARRANFFNRSQNFFCACELQTNVSSSSRRKLVDYFYSPVPFAKRAHIVRRNEIITLGELKYVLSSEYLRKVLITIVFDYHRIFKSILS